MRADHELGNETDRLEHKYKKKVFLNITIKGIIKALTLCFPFCFLWANLYLRRVKDIEARNMIYGRLVAFKASLHRV